MFGKMATIICNQNSTSVLIIACNAGIKCYASLIPNTVDARGRKNSRKAKELYRRGETVGLDCYFVSKCAKASSLKTGAESDRKVGQ